jgi:hypothetical protein
MIMRRPALVVLTALAVGPGLAMAPAAHADTAAEPRTRVSIQADRLRVSTGQPVHLTGRAEWQGPDGSWRPYAGQTLSIDFPDAAPNDPAACDGTDWTRYRDITTSSDGTFSFSAVLAAQTGLSCRGRVGVYVPDDGSYQYSSTETPVINVVLPAQRLDLDLTVSHHGQTGMYIHGGMYLPDIDDNSGPYAGSKILVEYSPGGRGHWKTVTMLTANRIGLFASHFHHTSTGYWRVRFTGNAAMKPATSKVWRIPPPRH